jgi:hypothetical protein
VTEEDIPEPGTVVTTVRIRREQHDRLREIAAHEHRSMGGEIRRLIDERIAAYEDRQPQS